MVGVHGGEAGHVHYHPMPPSFSLHQLANHGCMGDGWVDGWMVLHVPIFSTEHKLSQSAACLTYLIIRSPGHQVLRALLSN